MKMLLKIILRIFLVYVLVLAFFKIGNFESRMLFFPQKHPTPVPAGFQNILTHGKIQTSSGDLISYWVSSGDINKPVIIFSSGNATTLDTLIPMFQILSSDGNIVVMYDYSGYGESTGSPSEKTLYANLDAVIAHVKEKFYINTSDIILAAHSLGSAVAINAAYRENFKALLLITPFTSISGMRAHLARIQPVFLITKLFPLRYSFNSLGKIAGIDAPIYIFHSNTDEIVPYFMGAELAAQNNRAKLFSYKSGGHNEIFWFEADMRQVIQSLNNLTQE